MNATKLYLTAAPHIAQYNAVEYVADRIDNAEALMKEMAFKPMLFDACLYCDIYGHHIRCGLHGQGWSIQRAGTSKPIECQHFAQVLAFILASNW